MQLTYLRVSSVTTASHVTRGLSFWTTWKITNWNVTSRWLHQLTFAIWHQSRMNVWQQPDRVTWHQLKTFNTTSNQEKALSQFSSTSHEQLVFYQSFFLCTDPLIISAVSTCRMSVFFSNILYPFMFMHLFMWTQYTV